MGVARRIRAIATRGGAATPSARSRLVEVARAGEWWEYKLVPILAVFYATALVLRVPITSLWPAALTLLAALVPGAVYVSLINDLTDRKEDSMAGKVNRLAGRSASAMALLIGFPVAAGLFFAWMWRDDPLLLVPYLAAWAAFSLYSIPPFRLKARGFPGVLADACGAHLLPTMVGAALVFRATGAAPSLLWLASAGIWALAYGLRGILWHQLLDAEHDRAAAVRTFVLRQSRRSILRLAHFVLFPIEICTFAFLMSQMTSALPLVFLLLYGLLVKRRLRLFRMNAVIVEPRPRYLIILHEYYDLFLPLALLLASAWRFPLDLLALVAHFILFPRRLTQTARDLWKLRPF
jgi:1,4-dihydroxy-2-naphthoate octaprenyltransferase